MLKELAEVILRHKWVVAYRLSRTQMVLFNTINISLLVEKEVEGKRVPVPLVLRNVEQKSCEAITAEIRKQQIAPVEKHNIQLDRKLSNPNATSGGIMACRDLCGEAFGGICSENQSGFSTEWAMWPLPRWVCLEK